MMQWDERFETGNNVVDSERREVFDAVRKVFSLDYNDRDQMNSSSIGFLAEYAGRRFANEEALMDRSNFLSADKHKEQHRGFERQIDRLRENFTFNNGSFAVGMDVNDALINWLVTHVMGSDKVLVDHCKKAE